MVNNAGMGLGKWSFCGLHLAEEEQWDLTMNVNAKSVFLGCKYALGQMLRQDPHPSGERGWIVNMSSIASMIAIEGSCMSPFPGIPMALDWQFLPSRILRFQRRCQQSDQTSGEWLRVATHPYQCDLSWLYVLPPQYTRILLTGQLRARPFLASWATIKLSRLISRNASRFVDWATRKI